ncbi:MAG: phosphotransferase, partial [Clostridiales bacterium]|nr:phosphotransferase [Clostridiales bacterium]
ALERTKVLEYQMLCRVYALSGPGLDIPAETFSAGSADAFYRQWAHLAASPRDGAADALALLENRRPIFDARRRRLAEFSARCRSDGAHFYITHGDAGGNVILDGERCFLVDWDDAMYAPPERDAWFCLHWDWAMAAFAEALAQNGLNYALRPERLAYYCYHWFFHYLTLYLATFFEAGSRGLAGELSGYLGGWIEDNLRYADSLP